MLININYDLLVDSHEKYNHRDLTYNLIGKTVEQSYPDGLENPYVRTYGRIQRKFDQALKEKLDTIELEESEKDFLKEVFNSKSVKFQSQLSKFIILLQDEINRL